MKDKQVDKQTLWTFYYHRGPAHVQGIVEARNEDYAMRVATRWCESKGFRPPASVQTMVVASEEILHQVVPNAPDPLVDPVAATTMVNVGNAR